MSAKESPKQQLSIEKVGYALRKRLGKGKGIKVPATLRLSKVLEKAPHLFKRAALLSASLAHALLVRRLCGCASCRVRATCPRTPPLATVVVLVVSRIL